MRRGKGCGSIRSQCRRGSGGSHEFCPLLKDIHVLRSLSLRPTLHPSYNTPPCEVSMPFTLRLYRRLLVQCAVTYNAGLFQDPDRRNPLYFTLVPYCKVAVISLRLCDICVSSSHMATPPGGHKAKEIVHGACRTVTSRTRSSSGTVGRICCRLRHWTSCFNLPRHSILSRLEK